MTDQEKMAQPLEHNQSDVGILQLTDSLAAIEFSPEQPSANLEELEDKKTVEDKKAEEEIKEEGRKMEGEKKTEEEKNMEEDPKQIRGNMIREEDMALLLPTSNVKALSSASTMTTSSIAESATDLFEDNDTDKQNEIGNLSFAEIAGQYTSSYGKREALFKAIKGAAAEFAKSREAKQQQLQEHGAKERTKHKLPPSVFTAFKNQNPYRNEVPPTPTKKTVGGGDKSEDENLKTQTILFQRTKNVIQQANDLTESKYDVFRGKSSCLGQSTHKASLTGLQFAAEEKQKAKSEEKIEAKAAPLTRDRRSTTSYKSLVEKRTGAKLSSSKEIHPQAMHKSRHSSIHRTRSSTPSQDALRISLDNLKQQMRERHQQNKSKHSPTHRATMEEEVRRRLDECRDSFRTDRSLEDPIDTFIRKSWLVFMLCKVCFGLRRYAFEGGVDPKGFEAYVPYSMLTAKHDSSLQLFNPADYKAVGEATWHADAWQSILKPIGTRNPKDIARIVNIMRSIREFNDYPPELQISLCQYIRYERFGKNRVVIRRGDIGYQYYYVYSGRVHITYAQREAQLYSRGASLKTLSRGDSFGEQALISGRSHRRTATVICCENCELLTIDCDYFETTGLRSLLVDRMAERLVMIRKFELFESWSDEQIAELSNNSVTEFYGYEKVVIGDARHNDFVYLCIKGRCEILRLVDLTSSPLYGKIMKRQKVTELQNLQHKISQRSGITLRDEIILDSMTWWPDSHYEDKYMEIKLRHDRNLGMSRDLSMANFVDNTGHVVRGSTINILKQLAMGERDDNKAPIAGIADHHTNGNPLAKSTANTMTLDTMGTKITFTRQNIINRNVDKKTPHGVFMNVGELTRGGWFGIEDLWGNATQRSLVSRGCSLVRIPKSKIYEMIDMETVKKLRFCALTEQIPPDKELSREAMSRMMWRGSVNEIGRQAYLHQKMKKSNQNFVKSTINCETMKDRDFKKSKYFSDATHLPPKAKEKPKAVPSIKVSSEESSWATTESTKVTPSSSSHSHDLSNLNHMTDVVVAILKRRRRGLRKSVEAKLKNQLVEADKRRPSSQRGRGKKKSAAIAAPPHIVTAPPHAPLHNVASVAAAAAAEAAKDEHPEEIMASQARAEYGRKVGRLLIKARLRALQKLIHTDETPVDKKLNDHIDQILETGLPDPGRTEKNLLKSANQRPRRCPLPSVHSKPDAILEAKSQVAGRERKTRCTPLRTSTLSYIGTKPVQLVRGIYCPLNKPAIRHITNGFD